MELFYLYVREFISTYMRLPDIMLPDIIEILILACLVYQILVWFKNTRAWSLLKGIVFVIIFVALASLFNFSTILWIANNIFNVAIIALVIIFQPELRRALEQIGQNQMISTIFGKARKDDEEVFSEKVVNHLIRASFELGKAKTGALIVIERSTSLEEIVKTGIAVDGIVTSELLINIFEHNTPLHDGAVVVRGNRVAAATCYLPLSDNSQVSKELGTRHRAGLGISEASDAFTIIVSEETGRVSATWNRELIYNVGRKQLYDYLISFVEKKKEKESWLKSWRGKLVHEKDIDK